jgi:hypothetical protein
MGMEAVLDEGGESREILLVWEKAYAALADRNLYLTCWADAKKDRG